MGIFAKHLGQDGEIVIEGETYKLKQLTTDYIPTIMKIMAGFSGAKSADDVENIFKNLNNDSLEAIKVMIEDTLKLSYPDEPEEELKQFGMKYMMPLMMKIFELNCQKPEGMEQKKKLDLIDKLQKR